MAGATVTLGCNTFTINPSAASGVTVAKVGNGNFNISTTNTGTPSPLVVRSTTTSSQALSSHTVTFKTALGAVEVDTTREQSIPKTDSGDRITFEQNVAKATVNAGNASSSGSGDRVEFRGTVGSGSSVITGGCNDSVIFANSTVQDTAVNVGRGSDSIHFTSTAKVGGNIVIDFGAQTGTSDIDVLFGAAKSTFQGAGIKISNFDSGYDQIRVGSSTVLKTQSAINTYFGDTNSITLI